MYTFQFLSNEKSNTVDSNKFRHVEICQRRSGMWNSSRISKPSGFFGWKSLKTVFQLIVYLEILDFCKFLLHQ